MKHSLLQDASRAGLYHLPAARRGEVLAQAGQAHLAQLSANLSTAGDAGEVLRELGRTFEFPIWYGANFDALHDCLTDPDWQARKSLLLLVSGLEALRHNDPEAFSTLIDVLRSAAQIRSAEKHPMWILLTSPARGVANLPDA
ncbi:hypothetical protein AT959_04955 [Dechloromonas denitrificans]|uniref:Barstar (barnase inhibitor) domain-containing protein n=1 Tax=Dechloromonas denitrificans TaxID=281362 RepID=A0A133XL84_9RHOO|nr:barstar family protein [Dechloromonas denitrificans]KXB31709.1 hypothetical protein AT959_04955 [Dechloromonas denitrificans]